MYEIFTYGRFEVEPENEQAFIEAWSEFAAWISRRPGNLSVRLMRDIRNNGRLVSVGKWDDVEAVRAFKSAPEFKERLGRLVKAGGGTSERLSPPAGLEPIHAPT